ncbi:type 2 isopentenyl-diphosphate Delta-isomerase [Hyperthermus butylicus]|uniref:Isopentenyl-diphosphate delta-isomerase n=1 Tax=Hyperthermus butylicus (strain DSM 5456 / JCM 9403 / PLM1-5) TaxID=415426 RepID=A2BK88_HYPBU|nr:type 2 isopentenyl-diphosphate Delta-isomerase [Hyperthermus butylicus]ABM80399.1 Isopentenyl-diphosphate delta-isomerase [Hyperthermus butylicus DSM 5456]
MQTKTRKLDHIRITVDSDVEHPGKITLLEHVELVHRALPETALSSIDTSIEFLGKQLSMPLMVTGMTGGHPVAARINCVIARAAARLGIAIGVGSQRAAIEDPSLEYTFRVARDCAREEGGDVVLVANLGAAQLVAGYGVEHVRRAIEMIDADAVAIHVNAAQEAFQPEGDVDFRNAIDLVAEVARELDKPVIVKETGHGLGYEVVYVLRGRGIRFFDVSGAGGTSWVRVEYFRARIRGLQGLAEAAKTFSSWGIPTAQAVVETRWAAPDSCIIASGGVRTGLDAAKAIALGADIAGLALPVIRAYTVGDLDGVIGLLERIGMEFKAALFLTGASSLAEARRLPLIVSPELESRLQARGVKLDLYLNGARLLFKPGETCSNWA